MAEEKVFLVRVLDLERDSGYFHAQSETFAAGDRCIVDHNGLHMGIVMSVLAAGEGIGKQLEHLVRKATASDMDAYAHNQAEAERVLASTREVIVSHDLPMHLVAAEYTIDRAHLRIYFTAPHRIDFPARPRRTLWGAHRAAPDGGTRRGQAERGDRPLWPRSVLPPVLARSDARPDGICLRSGAVCSSRTDNGGLRTPHVLPGLRA